MQEGAAMSSAIEAVPEHDGYTVPEVAYSADVEDTFVNREIDARVLLTVGHSPSGERLIDRPGVLYVAAVRELRRDLSKAVRRQIAEALRAGQRKVALGHFELRVSRLDELVGARLSEVERARDAVTIDPATCGGEPVLRGTRMRVHKIADLVDRGVSMAELEDEFDLTPQQIHVALLYSRLHPRRGRREISRTNVIEHVPPHR